MTKSSKFLLFSPSVFFASIAAAVARKLLALSSACLASHRRKEMNARGASLIFQLKNMMIRKGRRKQSFVDMRHADFERNDFRCVFDRLMVLSTEYAVWLVLSPFCPTSIGSSFSSTGIAFRLM